MPAPDTRSEQQREAFTGLVLTTRQRLQTLYEQPLPEAQMQEHKDAEFEHMRQEYRRLRDQHWPGNTRYDAWINAPMNNAKLLPFGLYDQWVPAFSALFKHVDGNWQAFYAEVERLAKLPAARRKAALRRWAAA